jgi:hypothetical protein
MSAVTAGVPESVAGIVSASNVQRLPNNPSLLTLSGMGIHFGVGLHERKIGWLQSVVLKAPSIISKTHDTFPTTGSVHPTQKKGYSKKN